MTSRKERLRKLVVVQEQLKSLHETRHAGFVAAAAAAQEEATDLVSRFDAAESMAGLFPEIYHRRIGAAFSRQEDNAERARREAAKIATATARTNLVERAYRDVLRQDDREKGDRERLEIIERKGGDSTK